MNDVTMKSLEESIKRAITIKKETKHFSTLKYNLDDEMFYLNDEQNCANSICVAQIANNFHYRCGFKASEIAEFIDSDVFRQYIADRKKGRS